MKMEIKLKRVAKKAIEYHKELCNQLNKIEAKKMKVLWVDSEAEYCEIEINKSIYCYDKGKLEKLTNKS